MERLVAGMRKEFVDGFIYGLKELGIKVCEEPFEIRGVWYVIYQPIGRAQKKKSEHYIEYRCSNGLM